MFVVVSWMAAHTADGQSKYGAGVGGRTGYGRMKGPS